MRILQVPLAKCFDFGSYYTRAVLLEMDKSSNQLHSWFKVIAAMETSTHWPLFSQNCQPWYSLPSISGLLTCSLFVSATLSSVLLLGLLQMSMTAAKKMGPSVSGTRVYIWWMMRMFPSKLGGLTLLPVMLHVPCPFTDKVTTHQLRDPEQYQS